MADKKFEQYQKKVCDQAPGPPPLKKLCSPCTPNKSFIPPDWRRQVEEPFLNEAECEYQICVTLNDDARSFTAGEFRNAIGEGKDYKTREHLLFSFVRPAIRLILEDLNKLVAAQIICASHDGPTVTGLRPDELIAKYDSFEGVYMDLKDDPIGKQAICDDWFDASKTDRVYDPTKPIDMAQFVLRNQTAEVKNPFALELYARVIDFDIDPMQNLLKVLVTIPSFIIDQVPDAPGLEDILEEASRTVKEVVLEVPKLFGQISRLRTALFSYSKYQSYFHQTQKGALVFNESKRDFYASSYSEKVKSFYNDLKSLGKKRRWNFRSNIPSVVRKNADKIRITFSKDGDNPYSIKRVEAKIEGCDYVRVAGRKNKIIKKWSKDPTTMNYIAKIKEVDAALLARESYPWLDFLVKFTYPLLTVNYGTLNESNMRESLGECITNNALEFGGELRDYVLNEMLSLGESLAYEFNSKNNCAKLLDDNAIEKKYFDNRLTADLDARKEVSDNLGQLDDNERVNNEFERMRGQVASLEEKKRLLKMAFSSVEENLETRETDALDRELNGSTASEIREINKDIRKFKDQLLDLDEQIEDTDKDAT